MFRFAILRNQFVRGRLGFGFRLDRFGFYLGVGLGFFLVHFGPYFTSKRRNCFYLNANLPLKGRDLMQTEHFRAKQRFRKGRCLLQ